MRICAWLPALLLHRGAQRFWPGRLRLPVLAAQCKNLLRRDLLDFPLMSGRLCAAMSGLANSQSLHAAVDVCFNLTVMPARFSMTALQAQKDPL